MVEDRLARHVAETRDTLRSEIHAGLDAVRGEMHAGFPNLQEQIGGLRADLHREIAHLHEKIGEVPQKIAAQTRWLVTVILAATVLIPVMQKVLAELFP